MKLSRPRPASELAAELSARLLGDPSLLATGINEIHHVEAGDITFVDVAKYYQKALQSAATIILINTEYPVPPGKALLVVDNPFEAYNGLVSAERPLQPLRQSISPTARIGAHTLIEMGAVIGNDVVIGDYCHIQANVVIYDGCVLGDHVTIQANSVIGSDAFYYKKTPTAFHKWRSGGRVVIEDEVEIGANCTINRGVSSDTRIGAGTKVDCQVQIGHDTKVGRRCLFAAQVGIAGNCTIEDEVSLLGQVGIAENLTIGSRAVVLAQSGVSKNLTGGKVYFGSPAQEARIAYRLLAALRALGK